MAVVEDILRTRLQLVGGAGYARSVEQAARALGILKRDLDDAQKAELAMGIAAGAASLALVVGLERAGMAAGEHQAVLQRTALSFQQFGHSVPQAALEGFSNRLQDVTGIARDQIVSIAGLYAEYGQSEQQAEQLTAATLNAAEALKARGLSATTVATRIGIALERARLGDPAAFSRLSQIGIVIDRAKAAIDPFGAVMDALTKKGGNQAAMFRNTLPGAIGAFQSSLTRLGQDVGRYVVPPLTATLNVLTRILDTIDRMPGGPAAVAGIAGAASIGFAVNSVARILPFVAGARAVFAGVAARGAGAAAGGAAAGNLAANIFKSNPGLSMAEAELMAANLGGGAAAAGVGARAGFGARALGFLRGPVGGPLAAGALAFGANRALTGNQSTLGILSRVLTGAGAGALGGGALGSLIAPGPGTAIGTFLGGAAGAIGQGLEIQSERESRKEQTNAVRENTESNRDLKASMDRVYKSLDEYIGNSEIRDVLGDSRLVAAFARGIA